MTTQYKIIHLNDHPEKQNDFQEMMNRNWDIIGTMDDVGWEYWFEMLEKNPEFQFGVYEGEQLLGVGNCVPVWTDIELEDLPHEGWRWAIKASLKVREGTPKFVSAISATIDKSARGKRISQVILKEFKRLAKEFKACALIAPVRPNMKSQYPLIPMETYLTWRREDGSHFDTWLKIHESIGGKILKISQDCMIATRDLATWSKVTGQDYKSSGHYLVDGALNPIEIDLDKNKGIYREPGVWVLHELD